MRILVTGAGGQLGREMQRVARNDLSEHEFVFTDATELNITDAAAVADRVRREAPTVIVNCAAYTQVDQAEDDADRARLLNATAVGYLAAAAKSQGALLIHVSTDYVFGGSGNTPYAEDAPTQPLGIYGLTKREGELAILRSGCRHIIVRTAWLYSLHGHNFVKTILRLMHERTTLKVVFDQVGTPTYAGDLADAIGCIIKAAPTSEQEGIYHYTNEGVCSWYDFAIAIRNLTGATCDIRPCRSDEFPSKVTRPAFSVLDKTKIRTTFGLHIPHWQQSLAPCVTALATPHP